MLTQRIDGLLPASDPGPMLMLRRLVIPGTDPACLDREAWALAVDFAVRYQWRPPAGHELLRRIAQLAVHAAVTRVHLTADAAADHLGIGIDEWHECWADRYALILQKVQQWRQVAVMSLAPALGYETAGVAP